MGRLTAEAIAAGALGFSTSRTHKHKAADGRPTPSRSAGEAELAVIARWLKNAGAGVLECNADFFDPGDWAVLRRMVEISGRPLSVLLLQVDQVSRALATHPRRHPPGAKDCPSPGRSARGPSA